MNAIAFAAGKLADEFLLVGTREIEFGHICAGIHLTLTKRYKIKTIGDLVEDGLFVIQTITRLIDIT